MNDLNRVFAIRFNRLSIKRLYFYYSFVYQFGLYAFGLYTRRRVRDRWVSVVALSVPLLCAVLSYAAPRLWGYTFGYELLLLNGLLTAAGLWLLSVRMGQAGGESLKPVAL